MWRSLLLRPVRGALGSAGSLSGQAALPALAPASRRALSTRDDANANPDIPRQHKVGDLPRTRSVAQEHIPGQWPPRSPDAPADPATRTGGRETMSERDAEEAARLTIRHGSGKSAEAILAGPEAAEAYHSNTAVKFVYQQQPSPYARDVGVGTTSERAAEPVARQDAQVAGSGNEARSGGPTDDIPELGGMGGMFAPRGEMGADYGLRTPRQAGSHGAPPEAGGGVRSMSDMHGAEGFGTGTGGGSGGGGGGWVGTVAGNGVTETVKAGVGRLKETYQTMFGGGAKTGVEGDRAPDREGAGGPSGAAGLPGAGTPGAGHHDAPSAGVTGSSRRRPQARSDSWDCP
ncbi:hypothetical protein HYH03_014854 [Edaphochlamys debaryana]|uniref:Uncharacterized protein n=1 Tax=Edaphochlamys debaryana TaxID=47281 RepID=A0A836BT75_9CHLO|nr:hypothetical protein HYH03_014854 [Edaphochlamys debaryana]|eukprot:KAG2486553.1 hypothetical protein HYH03_014854 [Edaphochlamys debaryana]